MDIRFEGVQFAYTRGVPVLEIPALALPADGVTAIIGPNGSGKSTLLRLIAGLERPATGRVWVGDGPARTGATAPVSFVFQSAVFVSGTVRANLDLALRLRRVEAAERMGRIEEAARACGIHRLLDRPANALSGGERQRANLARALAIRAPVTLMDEPLAGLDAATRATLLSELPGLLRTFAETTVLVTHDAGEALRLARHIVLMDGGRVLHSAPAGQAWRNPPTPRGAALLGYTVLSLHGETVAIAPGALRQGGGPFRLEVVSDMAAEGPAGVHIYGHVGGVPVEGDLDPVLPRPATGDVVVLGCDESLVRRWDRDGEKCGEPAGPN